ncbi:steroid 5-alpha reductase family enzyme [Catenulispora sp. MAP12-49]
MDALKVCLYVYAAVCLATWLMSVLTREYSWVDRIWSIVPVAYVGIFAGTAGFHDTRLNVMAVLVTLWGARLTFNFARKGGYARGGEDYRWAVLRDRMAPWQFQLFNIFFITLYQNAILLLIALPAKTALDHRTSFTLADGILTALFAGFLVGETLADQQQWRFQQTKRADLDAGREPSARFVTTGLFRFSRHPNFTDHGLSVRVARPSGCSVRPVPIY